MKLWKAAAAAALIGTMVLAGCGNDASQSSSSSAKEETASESAEASSVTEDAGEKEADKEKAEENDQDNNNGSDKESETASSSEETVTGEDYSEDILPTIKGEYTYEDCMKLGQYKGIELTKMIEAVTDEDVEAYIKSMNESEEVTDPEAKAELGDTVNIAYVGTKDGVAFDGGTSNGYDLVLGSGSFIDGFEDGVVGMKVGEEKDLELTFPEEYHAEDLAGQDVVFHVTVNAIKRAPEITDEWVKENYDGEFETVDELFDYTRKSLEENASTSADTSMRQTAWIQVYDDTEFYKLPENLFEEGAAQYEQQYEAAAQQYGMTLDEYLEAMGLTKDDLEAEKKQYAQSVAKNLLIMNAIWDAEKMEEDEEYDKIIENLASAYGQSAEDFIATQDKNAVEQYAKTQKILNFIVDNAKITEETAS